MAIQSLLSSVITLLALVTSDSQYDPYKPAAVDLANQVISFAAVHAVATDSVTEESSFVPEEYADLVKGAKSFLSAELSVDDTEFQFVRIEPVVWNDAGIGCKEKEGMVYAQVETPGYRMTFRRNSSRYSVHSSGSGADANMCYRAVAAEL